MDRRGVYTGGVRLGGIALIITFLAGTIAVVGAPGCEEVLEACAPCGSLSEGGWTELGDPRLDETIKSVDRTRFRAYQIAEMFRDAKSELAAAFAVAPDADEATLLEAITGFLQSNAISSIIPKWRAAECYVDWNLAVSTQQRCEKSLCNITQFNETALCNGYFAGPCVSGVRGVCLFAASDACEGLCGGACDAPADGACPGMCSGICDGECSEYDESGNCRGTCLGRCEGICESSSLFPCDGHCVGLCEIQTEDGCPEGNTFMGNCDDPTVQGGCRGHLFPAGCDEHCPNCDEERVVSDCRETAKLAAWSATTCRPANLELTLTFTDDATDVPLLIHQARTLERVFSQIATDYAWLSLLVDGDDVRGRLASDDLDERNEESKLDNAKGRYEAYFESTEGEENAHQFVADRARLHLPLENLKARLTWLQQIAGDSERGYRVSAGAFVCLYPALEEALALMQQMVPTKTKGEDAATFEADRACTESSPEDAAPCLYDLMESQASFLELIGTF